MTREEIANRALELRGIRFHPQGRSREGLSCDGVLALAGGIAGTAIDEVWHHGRELKKGQFREALLRVGFVEVIGEDGELPEPLPGQAMIFKSPISGVENHAAVRTESGMVHVNEEFGEVRRSRYDIPWPRMLSGVFEFPGVEEGRDGS